MSSEVVEVAVRKGVPHGAPKIQKAAIATGQELEQRKLPFIPQTLTPQPLTSKKPLNPKPLNPLIPQTLNPTPPKPKPLSPKP